VVSIVVLVALGFLVTSGTPNPTDGLETMLKPKKKMSACPRFPALALRLPAVACLVWLTVPASSAEPSASETSGPDEKESAVIAVELNKAEPIADGCRLSFVIRNHTSHAFSSLQWDLVLFDPDELIAARIAAEAAPLPAEKTSVKLFDVPGLGCNRLHRVLLNDVMRCETGTNGKAHVDCLRLTMPSSRADIELFK
jgi:hypothetical protein